MTHRFDDAALAGVLGHMNRDHGEDSLLIVRALGGHPDAVAATMTGFDGDGGDWRARSADGGEADVRVPWPDGPIEGRPEVRREIVALYDESCRRLGLTPRPHG